MVSLKKIGGTDKMVRFQVFVEGTYLGELLATREDFTKLSDRLLGDEYELSANTPILQ